MDRQICPEVLILCRKLIKNIYVMLNNFMIITLYLQLREDIDGVENAFSDLHRRYEKLKMVVEGNLKVWSA